MLESRIDTIRYENGEFQRFQVVSGFGWKELQFVQAPFSKAVFNEFARIFGCFIVPKSPQLYGALVTFHVPDDLKCPFSDRTEFGTVLERQLVCAMGFRRLVRDGVIRRQGREILIDDPDARAFYCTLQAEGWLSVVYGSREDGISFLPIGSDAGYLSSIRPIPRLVCNSHFFELDALDMDSPYDLFGTPFGMSVKDGAMTQPPLNGREALVVGYDGKVRIERPEIRDIDILIQGRAFRNNANCSIFRRPETRITPKADGLDLIIVGNEVLAFHQGGSVMVPSGGFVLHTDEALEIVPSKVTYMGFEDVLFAIQVGTSSVKDGELCRGFQSPFFDVRHDNVPYPPSLYPLDYGKDRAPRMAICSDGDGLPVLVWAEGPSKLFYRKGQESCGASLLELGRYCKGLGLVNVLNMDGGGSAEIFLDGRLSLHVSDRHADNSDAERPVPMGLMVR